MYKQQTKEIMIHEKSFLLRTGRIIKLIVRGYFIPTESGISTHLEVLIKDPKEEYFHAPIGMTHPQFWKLKRLNPEQAQSLQIAYSGVSEKHINKIMREFENIAASSVVF